MTGLLEGPDEVQEERKKERGDGGLMEIFGGFEKVTNHHIYIVLCKKVYIQIPGPTQQIV